MLDGLAWDEEEARTNESVEPHPSPARDGAARRWDTVVDEAPMAGGPTTTRDAAPVTETSPDAAEWLTNWDDGDATYPRPRDKAVSTAVSVEDARPDSIAPDAFDDMPQSAIRRTGDRHPVSVPLPLLADDEDLRETTRRGVVSLPRRPLRSPSPSMVVDERLLAQVAKLERGLRISLAVGLMALLVSVVLAVLLVSTPRQGQMRPAQRLGLGALARDLDALADDGPPVAAEPASQGITVRSAQPGLRIAVDGEDRGELPITLTDLEPGTHELRFEGGEAFAAQTQRVMVTEGEVTDLGEIALERDKVEVLVALLTPHASVALTPIGGLPEPVGGPWPKKLYLPEGKYTLTAATRGKRPVMAMLDLSLDHPKREIVLRVR